MDFVSKQETGVDTAIRLAGGQELLANHLGVTQQWVSTCKKRGYFPLEQVPAVHAYTGVDRRKLVDPRILEVLGLAEEQEGNEAEA